MTSTVTSKYFTHDGEGRSGSGSLQPYTIISTTPRRQDPDVVPSAASAPTAPVEASKPSTSLGGPASDTDMIAVPAGLFGGILGAIGGVVGQIVGGSTGDTISGISGVVGAVLPFQMVPCSPTTADPEPDDLIAVPAGLLGGLVGGLGGLIGKLVGGSTGDAISQIAGTVGSVLPLSSGPDGAGDGTRSSEDLVLLPAGLFGRLVRVVSEVGGVAVGGTAGGVITSVGSAVGDLLPFSTVPNADGAPGTELIVLPAGLFGDLIGAVGGLAGHLIGGDAGRVITDASKGIRTFSPFSVIAQ